jgi:hypothetical protein
MVDSAEEVIEECRSLLGRAGREEGEVGLLVSLSSLFAALAVREDLNLAYPRFAELYGRLLHELGGGNPDGTEEGLTMIYAYLHGCDMSYDPEERAVLDARGGYWCHAGGLSPLWRAAPHIHPGTRAVDYGAGNGLQGLLLQHLYPHRLTTLVELSGPMIEKGKALQGMLGIPAERIEWVHGSVEEVSPRAFDFIYLYRPLRPEGEAGRRFYEWFAGELEGAEGRVTIFSVADCLRELLDRRRFTVFYDDGQLTCYSGVSGKEADGASGRGRKLTGPLR